MCALSVDEVRDVRNLKQHLQSLCGRPRFAQRLLHNCVNWDDDTVLTSSSDVDIQLVLLPFVAASQSQALQLVRAAEGCHIGEVEEILQRPQDPNMACSESFLFREMTPLGIAAENGHLEIVQLLLEAAADVDKLYARYSGPEATPLGSSVSRGHVAVARALLEACANADKSFGDLQKQPWVSCSLAVPRDGMEEFIGIEGGTFDMFFERQDHRCSIELEEGANMRCLVPIGVAAETSAEIVHLLLVARADKEGFAHPFEDTPLFKASKAGDLQSVRLLLEARADANGKQHRNRMYRARSINICHEHLPAGGHDGIYRFYDSFGGVPLRAAARSGHIHISRVLLEARAQPDERPTETCMTPLCLAVEGGHVDIVSALLDAGAETDQCYQGKTPLYIAAASGHIEIVRLLLDVCADFEQTARDVAYQRGHTEIVHLLARTNRHCNCKIS